MGRIVITDGVTRRTVPAQGLSGEIEIDLSGREKTVRVPESVRVEREG